MTTVAPSFRAYSDGDSGILDASKAELVPFNVPSLMNFSVCYSKLSVTKQGDLFAVVEFISRLQ